MTVPIRGITTCVGYARYLAVTLPRNIRHLQECVVVTSPEDHGTLEVCQHVSGVRVHVTDAFTRYGARFNKGLAMEEGFDVLGRAGWILIWDADIVFPEQFPYTRMREGYLIGARRRLCRDLDQWQPSMPWGRYHLVRDGGPVGYFQLFQAEDPAVAGKRPWYDVTFAHAGGGDAYFLTHWPPFKHMMLGVDVLHLGPCDAHWFGTDEEGKKIMRAFVCRNGWRQRDGSKFDPDDAHLVGEIVERVQVPGQHSEYELPFVKHTRMMKDHGP
jgi:hypothetical protein